MNQPCFEIPFPLCSFFGILTRHNFGWHFIPRTSCSWSKVYEHFSLPHLTGLYVVQLSVYCAVSSCHVALGSRG